MYKKLKYLLRDDRIYKGALLILLLVTAFLLGRISVQVVSNDTVAGPAVRQLQASHRDDFYTTSVSSTTADSVYASVNGTRYYAMDCGAGTRIDPDNRLYFSTPDPAEAAGYTPSEQCVFP